MFDMRSNLPFPANEPEQLYKPGSPEREKLQKALDKWANTQVEIPLIIGGKEVKTGKLGDCIEPHNHKKVIAKYHIAGEKELEAAIKASQDAKGQWEKLPYEMRASIFIKAAELLTVKYRYDMAAITMLSLSKTPHQCEIDVICELADFWRFNPYFMEQIYAVQPPVSPKGMWNYLDHRALEGFVFAVTPFNFASIAGNLPTAPAMMGNVVLWKPASNAVYPSYFIMKILMEAGLPEGVINFIPGSGRIVGEYLMNSPDFAGIHFTGGTEVFRGIWKTIGNNIAKYKTYPRIVGETGGKDFIVAHPSAEIKSLGTALIRGAFEYQGQKCSACSRAYLPQSLWPELEKFVFDEMKTIKVGPVQDHSNFMNAVIDKSSYDNIVSYIEYAKKADDAEIIFGGTYSDEVGYFVQPTIIKTTNPKFKTMEEEIFGPVLTIYIYEDEQFEQVLELCDSTSIYGLTGAIFSKDRNAIHKAMDKLRHAAGNFYINDKPTGAVVGQQPFGGARGSGTNDKAGAMQNLQRWVSMRTVKETFTPPEDYRYPFLG